jgi:putative DNA methylase
MIEIPPKFAGMSPVNPESNSEKQLVAVNWKGAEGLAEDIEYYGRWVSDEAKRRIGNLYPCVTITYEMAVERPDLEQYVGKDLTVIAWLWARTVKSPNPAFSHVDVPLSSTFALSTKKGREAYIEPVISGDQYSFVVRNGLPSDDTKKGTKLGRGNFSCLLSGAPIDPSYLKKQGEEGHIGQRMLAVVVEGDRKRVYIDPTPAMEQIAQSAIPSWAPQVPFLHDALGFRVGNYGHQYWADFFTKRQQVSLSTFYEVLSDLQDLVAKDAIDSEQRESGSDRAISEYAQAIITYCALCVSRLANRLSSQCFWDTKGENVQQVFARQALPMTWDFVEANPFSTSSGNFVGQMKYLINALLALPARGRGTAVQDNAMTQSVSEQRIVSTDPPYYDNIGYADLSDFFYVWLRKGLQSIHPELFSTVAVPKEDELVATPARHGGKEAAGAFFLNGMTAAFENLGSKAHQAFPITIFYAFRQSESEADGTSSTGWETFLDAVFRAGYATTATWPMRTEYTGNLKTKRNALASSIVLSCRRRHDAAPSISRRDFIRELNSALPFALDAKTRESEGLPSPVAPVDLSQAIIGPGMAVFSKYSAVLEADGSPMSVKTALQLINRFLAEDDFDSDTQFCMHWFEQNGWETEAFGEADVLARAKATSVNGLTDAGVIQSGSGKVRLLKWTEYPSDWDPKSDFRTPVWEALHHLIRAMKQGGESAAGRVLEGVASKAEASRQLAYRLYTLCERKGWAEDARAYNEIITSWSAIESAAPKIEQRELF